MCALTHSCCPLQHLLRASSTLQRACQKSRRGHEEASAEVQSAEVRLKSLHLPVLGVLLLEKHDAFFSFRLDDLLQTSHLRVVQCSGVKDKL